MPRIQNSLNTSFNRNVRSLMERVFWDGRFAWFENRLYDAYNFDFESFQTDVYGLFKPTDVYGLFKPSLQLIELADILAHDKH